MIDVSNRVLTNVKIYIEDLCKTVQSDSSKTPSSFPATSVVQIDSPDASVDLENTENAVTSFIEIQTFSNKNMTEAKAVINKACDAMRIMGYVRTYGPAKLDNASDTNVYRRVARFKRVVNSVDEIKRFETGGA